jgi:hypothetical protein
MRKAECKVHKGARKDHARYEIRVRGVLDERWSHWFTDATVTVDKEDTVLIATDFDQAALHGLLAKIRDLGLPLVSVKSVDPES